jgi:hypothetical protein
MEEFVTAIQKNKKYPECYAKVSKLRKLILKLISSPPPKIKIVEPCNREGDIKFEVNMKNMGISFETYIENKNEILFDFTVNFIGELLVRENIEEFTKILTGIDKDDYSDIVNKYEHKKFGVKVFRNKFIFSFHVSLLQSILFEGFKKKTVKYDG